MLKMNWGNKLLLTFVLFALLMSYLVYRSVHTDFDLVTKDYYKDELAYQQVIDGTNRANLLNGKISLSQQDKQILLHMPADMKGKTISGEVFFYCAADARRDKKFELKPDAGGNQQIDAMGIIPGAYSVKISWDAGGLRYYSEEIFTVN
jgi:hypothetical protein